MYDAGTESKISESGTNHCLYPSTLFVLTDMTKFFDCIKHVANINIFQH